MKKLLLTLITVLLLAIATQAQTVYITRTGAKYHRGDCRYLHSSKIRTTLADAKLNYTACSVCKPPTQVTDTDEDDGEIEVAEAGSSKTPSERAPSIKPKPSSTSSVSSRQCSGTTKSGARCKRMTTSSNGRCYQH